MIQTLYEVTESLHNIALSPLSVQMSHGGRELNGVNVQTSSFLIEGSEFAFKVVYVLCTSSVI